MERYGLRDRVYYEATFDLEILKKYKGKRDEYGRVVHMDSKTLGKIKNVLEEVGDLLLPKKYSGDY